MYTGSSYYQNHHNFIVYGTYGSKADFGAHDLHAVGNYYAYVQGSWGGWPSEGGTFANNTVLLTPSTGGYSEPNTIDTELPPCSKWCEQS